MNYSDIDLIVGVFNHDPIIERALHKHCKRYFDESYRSIFFADDEIKTEIFQESFITLWNKIQNKSIYVDDNVIKGKNGEPFKGKLTTYFMGIAKLKYKEWVRDSQIKLDDDYLQIKQNSLDLKEYQDTLYDEEANLKLEIIADCISHMSTQCSQILTMFYYEGKALDEIMLTLTSYESKNALKTAKYKCLKNLHDAANNIYSTYYQ